VRLLPTLVDCTRQLFFNNVYRNTAMLKTIYTINYLSDYKYPSCNINHNKYGRTLHHYWQNLRNLNFLRRHLRSRLRECDYQNTVVHRCYNFTLLFRNVQ